jgi:DNA-directed RNA polymerase specialized sigma24 family protein
MSEIRRKKSFESKSIFACDPPPEVPSSELLLDEVNWVRHALKSLNECIEKLAPEARYAVLLRYQKERLLTYEEMGRICRARPTTLQMRVARAMERLRQCLERKGVTL